MTSARLIAPLRQPNSLPKREHCAWRAPSALLLAGLGVGLLSGCPPATDATTTTDADTTTGGATTSGSTVPTTTQSNTTVEPTTGGTATTGPTTGDTSTGAESSTGTTATACPDLLDMLTCEAVEECRWSGVVQFTYSAQGCQGNIAEFCVPKMPAGSASAWWRDVDGDTQVVEFAYTPQDLADEWKPCDCDGPLACLCTSVTEDCPDRQEEFCGVNITELGCTSANFKGNSVCGWFAVDPNGPKDDMCTQNLKNDRCLPAYDTDKIGCDDEKAPLPPYPDENMQPACPGGGPVEPLFWHEKDGILEITEACGPKPTGWTRCEPVDTPDQPDECKCNCLG